jgi:type I restriction enzyme S subunit
MEVRPGYKQTEVGVIPEEWEVTSVARVCSLIVDCKNRTPPVVDGGGFAVVRTPNVRNGKFVREELRFTDEQSFRVWTARAIPQIGDILITREAPLGEVCLVPWNVRVCLGQRMMLYRPDREKVDGRFLLNALMSSGVQSNLLKKVGGSTVGHAKVDDIRNLQVPLPPTKAEQKAIAEALSDADALIESLEQLIAKKRLLKQGAMQELLRPKEEWVEKRLGNTAVLKARIGWQGLTTTEYLDSGDFYLVTGTDFKNGYIDWSNCHYVAESRYRQDTNIQLKEHDVLVTKDGTIGKVALITHLEKPATLNSGVFVIRAIEDAFHPDFFYHLLCSYVFTEFLVQLSAGSTINHLYQKDFVHFIYETPATIEEQTAIATILSDMDAEIAAEEAKLTKVRQLKQGMMQELLTGGIRLI